MVLQSKYKGVKFSCKQRAPLLSALYHCIALAAAQQRCPIATKILGSVIRNLSDSTECTEAPHEASELDCYETLWVPCAGPHGCMWLTS